MTYERPFQIPEKFKPHLEYTSPLDTSSNEGILASLVTHCPVTCERTSGPSGTPENHYTKMVSTQHHQHPVGVWVCLVETASILLLLQALG